MSSSILNFLKVIHLIHKEVIHMQSPAVLNRPEGSADFSKAPFTFPKLQSKLVSSIF